MPSVKEIVSQRGKVMLLVDNYKFSFKEELKSGEKKWCCRTPNCLANIYTVGLDYTISKSNLIHNHSACDIRIIQRQAIASTAKRIAVEDVGSQPSKILRSVIAKEDSTSITTTDLSYIRKNMYNARRKLQPVLPKSKAEVHSSLKPETQFQTSRKEEFLLVNSEYSNILVFSCFTNLKHLCLSPKIYVDGTFDYCTKFFSQLFTIHGCLNGHYVPLVFCVLPDKATETYKKCFEFVTEKCSENSLSFSPTEIVADFELAIHNAAKIIWPQIQIIGCRFHVTQAWWRTIQRLGLSSDYKEKSEIGKWIGYCFGLLFLEPQEVGDVYAFTLAAIQPENDKVTLFADYLVNNYISEDAVFPPQLWASKTASAARTTNACESFHSHIGKTLNVTHPSVFIFIEFLINFQNEIYVKLQSIHKPYVPNSNTRKRQEYLQNKINDFNNGKVSTLEFIKLTSHYYSSTM